RPEIVPPKLDGASRVSKPLSAAKEMICPAATEPPSSKSECSPIVKDPLPVTVASMKESVYPTRAMTDALTKASVPADEKLPTPERLMVPALLIVLAPLPKLANPLMFQTPPALLLKVAVPRLAFPVIVPVLVIVLLPL